MANQNDFVPLHEHCLFHFILFSKINKMDFSEYTVFHPNSVVPEANSPQTGMVLQLSPSLLILSRSALVTRSASCA